jgi:hypothetical protein
MRPPSGASPVKGSSATTRERVASWIPVGWKTPVPTKRISSLPVARAAAKLHPSTCPGSGVRLSPGATTASIPCSARYATIALTR